MDTEGDQDHISQSLVHISFKLLIFFKLSDLLSEQFNYLIIWSTTLFITIKTSNY